MNETVEDYVIIFREDVPGYSDLGDKVTKQQPQQQQQHGRESGRRDRATSTSCLEVSPASRETTANVNQPFDPSHGHPAPAFLSDISSFVDGIAAALWPINKKIHDNPELGFSEFIAHETLTSFMRSQEGWHVTPSAYGLETAWIADYDTGREGPVISFNVEMGEIVSYLPP